MRDEEMAVNWIRSQGWSEENLPSDEFRQMFQAYLVGLKAGRLEWHKVVDGDLPKEESEVLCFGRMSNGLTYKAILKYDGYFHDENGTPYEPEIKAWCEIPKYTEE